jgi:NAD(P)-dependent dehydrogenase (short-subunit alcohol dehydrogenase family)
MSSGFAGKVAVVTGATSGIGQTTAALFAKNGAKVVVSGRSTEKGEAIVKTIKDAGGDAIFVGADVVKAGDVEKLMAKAVEKYGRIDYVVTSAGSMPAPGPMADESEQAFDTGIDVNLKGTWLAMKYAIPHLLKNGGAIVNVAATSGLKGIANWTTQCAAKHGVIGLTKAAALEYAKSGIRVNAVCPGLIRTPMLATLAGGAENIDGMAGWEPVGYVGKPEDVAEAILFMCADNGKFVTGHAMAVDGGMASA